MENIELTDKDLQVAEEIGVEPVRKAATPGVKKDPNAFVPAAPAVIKGELGDRPYLVSKVFAALAANSWEEAKLERRVHEIIEDELNVTKHYGGRFIPLNIQWLERNVPKLRALGLSQMAVERAQGENDLTAGGFLVSPVLSDEIIELMRAKAVVENAGAQVLDLPPGGQIDIPRQKTATVTYHVGENEPIGEGGLTFGMISLRAKYIGAIIPASNRSLRHTGGLLESFIRNELATALQLAADYDFIAGAGGTNIPLGIINWPGVQNYPVGAPIRAEDILNIEEKALSANASGPFAFIGNTRVRNKIRQLRSGTLRSDNTPDYTTGQFMFIRDLVAGETRDTLIGHPFFISTQIPTSATNTTYLIFGQFDQAIIAREPVLEIATDTSAGFKNDMTYFRALLGVDFGLKNEKAFVVATDINVA